MKKRVILINGFKRSGKDFTAKVISKWLGENGMRCEILSMATPLKKFVCDQFQMDPELLDHLKNQEEPIWAPMPPVDDLKEISNFRKLLQYTGDAIKELTCKQIFGMKLGESVVKSEADVFIVPDFRYMIELDGLAQTSHDIDIFTLRIDGDRAPTPDHSHESEWDLLNRKFVFNAHLTNNKRTTEAELLQQFKDTGLFWC